jgi:hypothetical protein
MTNREIAGRTKISERSTKDGRRPNMGAAPSGRPVGKAWNLFRSQHPRVAITDRRRDFDSWLGVEQ